jgi:hypothetical protein
MSVLVDLERRMREVQNSNQGDGQDIFLKLLQISKKLPAMLQDMANKLLQVPGDRQIPLEVDQGCRGQPLVQAKPA